MKTLIILTVIAITCSLTASSQVSISRDGSNAHNSAMLDVSSTSSGLLMPRMTTLQQIQIENPATGLMVFNTDSLNFWYYNGTSWVGLIERNTGVLEPWSCGGPFVYEGQQYNSVLIGEQCWMAENLNVGLMVSGADNQMDNGLIEKYCYGNTPTNCLEYGGLYQWDEMMQYSEEEGAQGICPDGWYIPTDTDWGNLVDYLGGAELAGGKLKEAGTAHWETPNTGGDNESGFTALPAGYKFNPNEFIDLQTKTYFRSSTMVNETATWFWHLQFDSSQISRDLNDKSWGFSVRCIKNQ